MIDSYSCDNLANPVFINGGNVGLTACQAASQLLRMLTKEEPSHLTINLEELLTPIQSPSKENISSLSALEIAEQMTFFDQKILFSIRSE